MDVRDEEEVGEKEKYLVEVVIGTDYVGNENNCCNSILF